jgi:hypothetical protein
MLEYMRTWHGPTKTASAALTKTGSRHSPRTSRVALKHSRSGDDTPSSQMEVIAVKGGPQT